MKLLISLIFIILASSTYRCGKGEDTIDCTEATPQMVGTWKGNILYTGPQRPSNEAFGSEIGEAIGANHEFTLDVESSSECDFNGTITYGEVSNNTVFNIVGNIDKYGWVTFTEITFKNDGGIYTDCQNNIEGGFSSKCKYWPTGRWVIGGVYSKGKFTNDPALEWDGDFRLPQSNYTVFTGSFDNSIQVDEITGGYRITKQ